MFHRTIPLPAELWRAVKARGQQDGKAIRWVIDDALEAELVQLVETLRGLGFRGERKADKLMRAPLEDNVTGRVNDDRRQTGLPAVLLLKVCPDRQRTPRRGPLGARPWPNSGRRISPSSKWSPRRPRERR